MRTSKGEYRFHLTSGNGEIILLSENYTSRVACRNGIEAVKRNAGNDGQFQRKTASNGQYYFNLVAQNGQVIGTSEMYASIAGRENGINSVKKNAQVATISDLTT